MNIAWLPKNALENVTCTLMSWKNILYVSHYHNSDAQGTHYIDLFNIIFNIMVYHFNNVFIVLQIIQ